MKGNFLIRQASKQQFSNIFNALINKNLDYGFNDHQYLYQADPHGFFLGLLDNKHISHIYTAKCSRNYGYIAMMYVDPQYRNQGISIKLFEHGLKYFGDRNIGYDVIPKAAHLYESYGFKYDNMGPIYQFPGCDDWEPDQRIVDLSKISFSEVQKYFRSLAPDQRSLFNKQWNQQPGLSIGYVEDRKLKGYSVLRESKKHFKISPLYADSPEIASALIARMRKHAGSKKLLDIHICGNNEIGKQLIESLGGKKISEFMRWYSRQCPKQQNASKIYGYIRV